MRFARWLLTKLVAPERRDAIIGDLEEDFARHASPARYWKEALIVIGRESRRIELADIAWPAGIGVAGAAIQITVALAGIRGPGFMFAYPLVALVSAMYVRRRYASTFAGRFWAVLAAFMLMSVIFYFALYSVITPRGVGNISWLGHGWRLAALLIIGIGAAAAIAMLVNVSDPGPVAFVVSLAALGTGALFVLGYTGWPGFLIGCTAILAVAAKYIYSRRVTRFGTRYLVTITSFVVSIVLFTAIHYLNHHIKASFWWPRFAALIAAGCVVAALIARFTPARPADATP
jgi:hypothetical protein